MKLIFLFLSLLIACNPSDPGKRAYWDLDHAIQSYSKTEARKEGALLREYAIPYPRPDGSFSETIDVVYSVDRKLQYPEARKIFYSLADGLLRRINENPSLRKCFGEAGASYANLDFGVSFDYDEQNDLSPDDVSRISIFENQIAYYIRNEKPAVKKMRKIPPVELSSYDWLGINDYLDSVRVITKPLPEDEPSKNLSQ